MSTGRLYWTDDAPPRIPAGSYEILRPLSVGTIGEADLARAHGEAGFIKPVVIKRLRPELAGRPDFRDILGRDTKTAVRLRAPSLVSVLDLGRDGEELYVSMEFVAGVSIAAWLDARAARGHGALPHPVAAFVTHQILEALEAAHDIGLTHGDLHARRVLVSLEGEVKVGGFGLTRCARLVETGQPAAAEETEDLGAVGQLLYEMISLRSFPQGQSTLVPLASDEDLDAFLRQAMVPRPTRRFSSATAMRAALGACLSDMVKEGRRTMRDVLRDDVPDAIAQAQRDLRRASLLEGAEGTDWNEGAEESAVTLPRPAPPRR
jgi:serine/threonine protein kinase